MLWIPFLSTPSTARADDPPECHRRLTINCGFYPLQSIAFSSDGSRIAAAFKHGTVKIWDARTGAAVLDGTDLKGNPRSLAYSPDASTLAVSVNRRPAAAEPYNALVFVDAKSGVINADYRSGDGKDLTGRRILYTPDGTTLISVDMSSIIAWNPVTADRTWVRHFDRHLIEESAVIDTPGYRLVFARQNAVGTTDLHLRDLISGHDVVVQTKQNTASPQFAFSPNGRLLAVATTGGGKVTIWRLPSRELPPALQEPEDITPWKNKRIYALQFLPDNCTLLSLQSFKGLEAWDSTDRAMVGSYRFNLSENSSGAMSLIFSPDAKAFAAIGKINETGPHDVLPPSWEIVVWDVPAIPSKSYKLR